MDNKVSIIIPCYNVGKYIQHMIDSLVMQTYDNLEIIFVNDGSKDDTEKIIFENKEKLENKGCSVLYKYQKNAGLGAAINTGLKMFTGDFLCWADPDDYFEPTAMEERVNFLLDHSEYGIVSCDAYIRDSNNLSQYKSLISESLSENEKENQFDLLLEEKSMFCSGAHMVRSVAFLDVNPDRNIYEAKRGQNWQMLLPIYYKYKRYFLNKPLYNYIDYPNSMSKDAKTEEFMIERYNEHQNIILYTLKQIENNEKVDLSDYVKKVNNKYYKMKMHLAIQYSDKELFKNQYREKKRTVGLDIKDVVLYWLAKVKI